MAGPQNRKRQRNGDRTVSRMARTKRRTLDADQRQDTFRDPNKLNKVLNPREIDMDQKGLGLFYCVQCDRHFPSEAHRTAHNKSKDHKRKTRTLKNEEAYTMEEANSAAGMGTDNSQRSSTGFTLANAMAKAKGQQPSDDAAMKP